LGIAKDDFLFLTVGTPVNAKGHLELGEAFARMNVGERNATLILNGSWPKPTRRSVLPVLALFLRPQTVMKGLVVLYKEGWRGVWQKLFPKPPPLVTDPQAPAAAGRPTTVEAGQPVKTVKGVKRTLPLDLPRPDVISAFLESDLFVFASKIEYSPLVLFEAAAAGTPFLTVPAGNAAEIVRWTGGGQLCPADVDETNYVTVSPAVLAAEMERMMGSPALLKQLGAAGQQAWRDRFTWATIAKSYEKVLRGETVFSPLVAKTDCDVAD
jgi:glycosyltransferase involved in cell wall biosynthesis